MPQTSVLDLIIPLLTIALSLFGVRKRALKVVQNVLIKLAKQQINDDEDKRDSTVPVAVGALGELVSELRTKVDTVSQQSRGDWEKLRIDLTEEMRIRRSDDMAVKDGLNNVSVRLLTVERKLGLAEEVEADGT